MTDEGARAAKRVFQEALDVEPALRAAFVDRACRDDASLRKRVLRLLEAQEEVGTFLSDPAREEAVGDDVGAVIGRFRLLEKIGEGGFSHVYMAEQVEPVRRMVAVKLLKRGMDSKQVIARFEAERQALAMMEHPGIARVFDAGTEPYGRPYFVMELVRGLPITEYCDRAEVDVDGRLRLLEAVCHAVQHAHQKGIIHRDIKPSNVLVTLHDGVPVPKVIDFGIAKAIDQPLTEKTLFTGLHQMIGTPEYMAPEQAEMSGIDIDTRADIYALGVLTYELLTGAKPFHLEELERVGFAAVLRHIREVDPPRPSNRVSTMERARLVTVAHQRRVQPTVLARLMRGDLDWIVMKALEKDRTRRYGSASELAADLERRRVHEPVVARPPGTAYLLRKYVQRHRVAVAAACAIGLSLVAGALLAMRGYVAANESAAEARSERDKAKDALRLAESERLATIAGEHVASDPALALLLAGESLRLADGLAARSVLLTAIGAHQEAGAFIGHDAYLTDARFDPSGRRVLTIAEEPVPLLWDVASRRVYHRLVGHGGQVHTGEFDASGMRIVTASADGTARIWNADTGATGPILRGSGAEIHRARFSPDGTRVVTCADDGEVRVFDAATGASLQAFGGDEPHVLDACWFPDGSALATIAFGGTVRILDLGTASVRHVLRSPPLSKQIADLRWQYFAARVLVSPDGARVFTARGAAFDARSGAPLPMPALEGATLVFLSRSTGRAVVRRDGETADDRWLETRDVATGATIARLARNELRGRFIDDEGRFVALWRTNVAVLDGDSGEVLADCRGHRYLVRTVRPSPDGRFLITSSADGTARLWDARESMARSVLRPVVRGFPRVKVQLTDDHLTAVVTRWRSEKEEPENVVVDMRSGSILRAVRGPDGESVVAGELAQQGAGLMVVDAGKGTRVFDVLTGAMTQVVRLGEGEYARSLSPDGRLLALSHHGEAGATSAWVIDTATGRALGPPCVIPVPYSLIQARCTNDGRTLVTGHSERFPVAIIWDVPTGTERDRFVGHTGFIKSLQVTPDGRFAATRAVDGTVRTWDLSNRRALGVCRIPFDQGTTIALSEDGRRVAALSGQLALVFDARTGEAIARIDAAPSNLSELIEARFTKDGHVLVAFDVQGHVGRWPMDAAGASASRANRELTPTERERFRIGTEADRDAALRAWADEHVSSTILTTWGQRCLDLGDLDGANAAFERAIELRPASAAAHLGDALVHARSAAAAKDPEARQQEIDEGLAALDRALEHAAPGRLYDPKDERLDPLRADPRCAEILSRHGR